MTAEKPPPAAGRPGSLGGLEAALGYRFRDREILERALTHSSWRHEEKARGGLDPRDNEALEFLGDALLGFLVARLLLRRHPLAGEGFLTRARARLVSRPALAAVARALPLGPCLRLGRGEAASGGAAKDSLLENALEAVVAAVLLDGGLRAAQGVVGRLLRARLRELERGGGPAGDCKSRLQELLQARGAPPAVYRLIEESGREHEKRFRVAVLAGEEELSRGEGRSKKQAQLAAACAALERLGGD